MEKESILNQIIVKNQLQDWASLDVSAIVDQLFNNLNPREKDVLTRRFGLHGKKRETLEGIGRQNSLTRERIRQIESVGINKIKKHPELDNTISKLRQTMSQLLEAHGGIMSQNHLFDILGQLSRNEIDPVTFDNYLRFLTSKVLQDDIIKVSNSKYFNTLFRLKYKSLEHLEESAEELLATIQSKKELLATDKLITLFKESNKYQQHQDKFKTVENAELDNTLSNLTKDIDGQDRSIYSLLRVLTDVEQNKFGYWGHRTWRDVNPKTINDKIYLVLKYNTKPMYYGDIASRIAELGFDKKKVNTATTHNELILDDKYILVGRGLYGLKEWGYKQGTVTEVIADILKESEQPLTKTEITSKVLEQRLVKQTTINLALMNKDMFQKNDDGKYQLKSEK